MNPSEKFVRFAAECELMAKSMQTRESKSVWMLMAERWLRCAALYNRKVSAAREAHLAKRRRASADKWAQEEAGPN
jgi:hypothetical protein